MSKWKAGQCVTIEGKAYRVMKCKSSYASCSFCDFIHKECNEYPCVECIDRVPGLLPYACYLKEIKPKS